MKSSRPLFYGFVGFVSLLVVYFSIVSLISGWDFAKNQFSQFWYFILGLAAGFGVQIGLYSHLKELIIGRDMRAPKGTVAVTGTTSTLAMVSCCAHYLANILPVLGISGILSVIGQYQVELFWIGLLFNLGGTVFILNKIYKFERLV